MEKSESIYQFNAMIADFIGPEFITGDVPNFLDRSWTGGALAPQLDQNGKRFLPFQHHGCQRLIKALSEIIEETTTTETELITLQIAVRDISAFVSDIEVYYLPDATELEPSTRFVLWNPEKVLFYPKPNNPAFKEYQQLLKDMDRVRSKGGEVSTDFLTDLRAREAALFHGEANIKERAEAMSQAVQFHLNSKSGLLAILLTLYSRAEITELMDRYEAKPAKKAKAVREGKKVIKNEQYHKSGHLVDQQLKYVYPPDRKGVQLSLFESLSPRTQAAITDAGIEYSSVVEGIKLTPTESKIVDSLCKMLHEQSQTTDKSATDYYRGKEHRMVSYGGQTEPSPKLTFSLYELTKEYKGGEAVTGKDAINVKNALEVLAGKPFLIRYTMTQKKAGGGQLKREIEESAPLIRIYNITDTETDASGAEVYRKTQIAIGLNPVFIHQIDSKFIICPADLTRRTVIAYGSPNVSDATLRLSEYLRRALSDKKQTVVEIMQDRLYYMLCEKMMNEGRRGKVKEFTEKAIQTVKNLNLVTKCEVIEAKTTSEPKVIFHLNRKWK